MESIIGIMFLATLIEGLIEYTVGSAEGDHKPWLKYASLALGIAAAIVYQVDIPAMVGLATSFPIANWIVSGIVIGRGANYANDLIGSFRKA